MGRVVEIGDIQDNDVLRALAIQFGVDACGLAVLRDGRNRIYGVAGGEPRVLKVIPGWVEEPAQVEAEVDWVGWLPPPTPPRCGMVGPPAPLPQAPRDVALRLVVRRGT